jgi:hypothetical protein
MAKSALDHVRTFEIKFTSRTDLAAFMKNVVGKHGQFDGQKCDCFSFKNAFDPNGGIFSFRLSLSPPFDPDAADDNVDFKNLLLAVHATEISN